MVVVGMMAMMVVMKTVLLGCLRARAKKIAPFCCQGR